jgi:prevent-host-death family protein
MSGEQFSIDDPKTNLSRIIERVEHGEEIIISRAGRPVAKVIPLSGRAVVQRGGRGSLRGRLVLAPDWDSDEVNESIGQVATGASSTPASSA